MALAGLNLVDRACTITVGRDSISHVGQKTGLDVWFQVKRSLKPNEPNTCDVRLTNLSADLRNAIASTTTGTVAAITTKGSKKKASTTKATAASTIPVTVTAGYVGGTSV